MPSRVQVLLQLANGLGYLHSLNILHGDIKPENILISSTTPVHMKWTGFGFTHLRHEPYSVSASVAKMNLRKWWSPEMYRTNKISKKSEIFSTGCVFLYFLLDGLHPFGSADLDELEKNVKRGKAS
jgi:serine/threonine-protein kinase/endoribonuclease IRE1